MPNDPRKPPSNSGPPSDALRTAAAIVARSGNNFHAKVAQLFRLNEWGVILSPYYVDPATDKAREVDLVAEKIFHVKHRYLEKFIGTLRLRLHVECKFIKHKTVFWFDGMDEGQAQGWINQNTLFKADDRIVEQHHYASSVVNQVAKLYATEDCKDVESDPIFRALTQCLNGLINSRGVKPVIADVPHLPCLKSVEYPVIVCSNFDEQFFRTRVIGDGGVERLTDNFHIEINYAYRGPTTVRREYFLVDVVDFQRLAQFLAMLDTEMGHMAEVARQRNK